MLQLPLGLIEKYSSRHWPEGYNKTFHIIKMALEKKKSNINFLKMSFPYITCIWPYKWWRSTFFVWWAIVNQRSHPSWSQRNKEFILGVFFGKRKCLIIKSQSLEEKKVITQIVNGNILRVFLCSKYVCEVQRGKKYKKTISYFCSCLSHLNVSDNQITFTVRHR